MPPTFLAAVDRVHALQQRAAALPAGASAALLFEETMLVRA